MFLSFVQKIKRGGDIQDYQASSIFIEPIHVSYTINGILNTDGALLTGSQVQERYN